MTYDLSRLRLSDSEKSTSRRVSRVWMWTGIGLVVFVVVAIFVSLFWSAKRTFQFREQTQIAGKGASSSSAALRTKASVAAENTIMAGGYIEAKRSAVVYPGREGVVSEVYVQEGEFVRKGDLLATLDTKLVAAEVAIAQAELKKAEAQLQLVEVGFREEDILDMEKQVLAAKARWESEQDNLKRLESLLPSGAVSERKVVEGRFRTQECYATFQAMKARLAKLKKGNREEDINVVRMDIVRAQATLQFAKEKLALSYLKAPFDGVIVDVELEPGEALSMMTGSEGQLGIELADTTSLFLKVDVPETRIAFTTQGSEAEIVVDALGQQRLSGKVSRIAPIAKRQSNTVEVSVRIEDPPALLRPNMSARVTITPPKEGD